MVISSDSLFILGAGGHGRVVADIAEQLGFQNIRFVDGRWPVLVANLHWPVVAAAFNQRHYGSACFVAIGNNVARLDSVRELNSKQCLMPILVHPSAAVSTYAVVGQGSVVMPQTVINSGAGIGMGCIVNTAATIDHDCRIGDGVHLSPGVHLAGGVTVGEASWIGIGACVKEGCRIGSNVIVAAGAVVVKDIADGTRVFGVPARPRE